MTMCYICGTNKYVRHGGVTGYSAGKTAPLLHLEIQYQHIVQLHFAQIQLAVEIQKRNLETQQILLVNISFN